MRARARLRLVAALAGLAGASFVATPALATVTTESFTFFNSGSPIATGMISYTPNVGTISSFSNANLINFDIYFNALPGPANTYSLSQLQPIVNNSSANGNAGTGTFIDFNTNTGQFQSTASLSGAPFYGQNLFIGAANTGDTIDFLIYNNGANVYSDNPAGKYTQPWTNVAYTTTVPEPLSLSLFGAGLLGLVGSVMYRRRRKRSGADLAA